MGTDLSGQWTVAECISHRDEKKMEYQGAQDTASEITEMDDWLEKTDADELSYISDEDAGHLDAPAEFRRILAEKERQIKNLRTQLATAKRIVKRNKMINQETNQELTDVLHEVLQLREDKKQLETTLECFKNQSEKNARKR